VLEFIDISVTIRPGMTSWPGLLTPTLAPVERMADGKRVNVSDLHVCAHAGTHIDAPWHHLKDGATVEKLRLDGFIGSAYVLDATAPQQAVSSADLAGLDGVDPFEILVVKTRNSTEKRTWERFSDDYIYLDESAAREIVRRKIKGVAVDSLSVEGFHAPVCVTHQVLLGAGIAVIEGVDLRTVTPGRYWLVALPLKVEGADGTPARAVLVRDPGGAFIQAWNRAREIG
jgi:arylformamidase